jgi:type IV secretion system protein VirB10
MNERINNNVEKPKGVVPKNAQTIIILIAVVVLVFVLLISGNGNEKKIEKVDEVNINKTNITEVNEAKLNALKKTIQEQMEIINQQQSYIEDMNTGNNNLPQNTGSLSPIPLTNDEITKDIQKKEYLSLISSPVAKNNWDSKNSEKESDNFKEFLKTMTNQKREKAELGTPTINEESESVEDVGRSTYILDELQYKFKEKKKTTAQERTNEMKISDDLKKANGKKYYLFEGTIIECVLMNSLNGTFAGPVNLMVTTPVYSHNRQHLLIPKGSFILGQAKAVKVWGQERLAIVNHRLIMPDGYSISFDKFKGLNQIGETGLKDKVNYHYGKIFGASIALGLLSGWADSNVNYSNQSGSDSYRSGVADSFSRSSIRILEKFLNIMPEVIIREGHRVKVYISGDMLLPDYNNHNIDSNI